MQSMVRKDVADKILKHKNIFQRGDFDNFKISNNELKTHLDIGKAYKYIRRWFSNGKWNYIYPAKSQVGNRTKTKIDIAKKTPLISGIKPLSNATEVQIDEALVKLSLYAMSGKLKCPALGNHNIYINGRTQEHIKETHNEPRTFKEMQHKAKYIPFIPEILKNGRICEKSSSKEGVIYGIIGQVEYFDEEKQKNVKESVELAINFDYFSRKFVFSFGNFLIKKSLSNNRDFDNSLACPIVDTKTVPITIYRIAELPKKSSIKLDYNGEDMLHKSFNITVQNITENNKGKKIEQVEKALNAMYFKKPFKINHLKADNSKNYGDMILRITNFDEDKIQKAVHTMAFNFDSKIKSAKGEPFIYKAQEELTDKFVDLLTEKTKAVYNFIISYFGLPEVRILSKADLKYKGKVLYNPETGEPIKKSEWNKFIKELEKFLNRNYSGIGEKIVLSAESLGRILERLSKTNTLENLKKIPLSNINYKNKKIDWISESSKNMQNIFGESVSRWQAARIEVATESAGLKIQKITDSMRNNIQDILINGIKNKESKLKVSQNLFDKCVGLNRDFQKIADTEIQNNVNNAYVKEAVYNSSEDEKVYFRRFEIVDDNTCKECKKIDGKIVLWSDTPLVSEKINDEYADYAIWDGKTDGLIPVGTAHPYCRGCWYKYYPELQGKFNKEK